jgi:hypothetical protein
MKLFSIAACVALGTTCLAARSGADDAANPKTKPRPYTRDPAAAAKLAAFLQRKPAGPLLPGGSPPQGLQLLQGDDCGNPFVISGLGTFNFDNSQATTGSQGQNEAICIAPGIDADLWYRWTAPAGGNATMTLCGSGTLLDSKIAAYPGSSCPANGTALACNDDYCSTESRIRFPVSAGAAYMLQLGAFPGSGGSTGIFTLSIAAAAPNDECASAAPIAGNGSFAFDNSLASTSPQQGLSCGTGYCNSDVWYDWTAGATGLCTWSLCGTASFDTLIAAYAGAGCPAPGSALGCNDDSCGGVQSELAFPCVAGNHYLLQLGAYATGSGNGTFSIQVTPPPPNDSCSTPTVLGTATGTFPFTLLGATTGTQGQQESACSFQGQTAIESDVWFRWTAPSSARAKLSLCAGASFDSKIAVYAGSGCPSAGSALTCNDDACGQTSEVCFDVIAGHSYMLQLGCAPGAAQSSGSFDLALQAVLPPCTYDDGSSENLLGLASGGDMVWLQRFGSPGSSSQVGSIQVAWGSPLLPGFSPGNGTPTDVFLWQDGPTQDGDPSDATLLLSIPAVVSNADSDTLVNFSFAPIAIQGVFFAGSHLQHFGGQAVAPMDQNCPSARVSWFFGAGPGQTVDYAHPGSNPIPPVSFDQAGFPANLLVRAGCTIDPALYLCEPGTAGVIPCPCSNPPSGPLHGCNNSAGTGGATIVASGSNSLSTPTLVFTTAGERPVATSILLQGNAVIAGGAVFGQGVRCVGGALRRLFVKNAVGGSIHAPDFAAGDPDIASRSAALGDPISAGQTRWYMVFYRDPFVLGGCSALATFNGTPTARISWLP